ncbi:MAG: tRNA (adenosine(37)-N6)-dimethylallyltransferase MiaA [Saprospiraceae bacterium]|nr:tRNA (adenosine(37)-N6)-dimethylallyltransferase MiaA [Saprospiraceae bacterium]
MADKKIIIVAGPTASGKTDKSIELAKLYKAPIISADSRQIYIELNIGTAKPGPEVLQEVRHYFINHVSIVQNYDVGQYMEEVSSLLDELFRVYDRVIVCGGSGLYIHSILHGLDQFPPVDPQIRNHVRMIYESQGVVELQKLVQEKDPQYFSNVDKENPRRLMRALEVCLATNDAYSKFLQQPKAKKNYSFEKVFMHLEREQLYQRINLRVDQMIKAGLVDEVKSLTDFKMHQALNTVGYKEVFDYFDGMYSYEQMIEKIKQHTRNYAKRQMTWFRKYFVD